MPTVHEFSKSLGSYATLTDLREAVEEALRDFNPDSRVSFRERASSLTLIARWEVQPCTFNDSGCMVTATHLDEDAQPFCDRHGAGNYPDYDDDTDESLTCGTLDCVESSTFKREGYGNRCSEHAAAIIMLD